MNILNRIFGRKEQKIISEQRENIIRRVYEVIYPDHGGNTFFSVVVWDVNLNVSDSYYMGWTADMRILEARYVIFGRIIYSKTNCAELNGNYDKYQKILSDALDLTNYWGEEFREFQKKKKKFHQDHPDAHGCRWDQVNRQVIE